MAELTQSAALELVRPILNYFVYRDERKAAKEAATLRFWRDGMLSQLKAIAEERATDETYEELKKNFDETERPVQEAIWALMRIKKNLGLSKLANQIDLVTSDEEVGGKAFVRRKIQHLLATHAGKPDETFTRSKLEAQDVLENIHYLNSELDRLYRMVYE